MFYPLQEDLHHPSSLCAFGEYVLLLIIALTFFIFVIITSSFWDVKYNLKEFISYLNKSRNTNLSCLPQIAASGTAQTIFQTCSTCLK